jgi:hypothetical protein
VESKLDSKAESSPAEAPPLPDEAPPDNTAEDDGWEAFTDPASQRYYFVNRFTGLSQWENPRVPTATGAELSSSTTGAPGTNESTGVAGAYNPAIHGDYDPEADYAKVANTSEGESSSNALTVVNPADAYAGSATFNKFTGRFQASDLNPENFNDENKSNRQMKAFFDVDAAANSHDGRSLKAERSQRKLSKQELRAYNEKKRAKKEQKRRQWLMD